MTPAEKVEAALAALSNRLVMIPCTTVLTFDALEPGGPPIKVRLEHRYDLEEARRLLEKALLLEAHATIVTYYGEPPA